MPQAHYRTQGCKPPKDCIASLFIPSTWAVSTPTPRGWTPILFIPANEALSLPSPPPCQCRLGFHLIHPQHLPQGGQSVRSIKVEPS